MNLKTSVKKPPALDIEQIKARFIKAPQAPSLVTAVEAARLEWQQSLSEFNQIETDMVDYVIFKINAAERRYMCLLEQAKKENAAAW